MSTLSTVKSKLSHLNLEDDVIELLIKSHGGEEGVLAMPEHSLMMYADSFRQTLGLPITELNPELKFYVVKNGFMDMIHHPILVTSYQETMHYFYNESFKVRNEALEKYLNEGRLSSYVFLHERPYRIDAFSEIYSDMKPEEYWYLLREIYVDTENLYQHYEDWVYYLTIDEDKREFLMDEDERDYLANLPDTLTVYRGYKDDLSRDSIAWTLSKEKAEWFANRFTQGDDIAKVVKGTVNKSDVIAYFSSRNESEIVILPENVKDKTVTEI